MSGDVLSVREIQEKDIESLLDYWFKVEDSFLIGMGVDLKKMPSRDQFAAMLAEQLIQPYEEKKSYCIIWQVDDKPVGHSNANKIIFGDEAYMHLHLWNKGARQKGCGTTFVKMTVPYFFKNLHLKKLYCEPYSLNPAPNKTLEKVGFKFVKEYVTVPGWINFEQTVKLWELTLEEYKIN